MHRHPNLDDVPVLHFRAVPQQQRRIVQHPTHVETRNRKPIRPNLRAPWELRVRNLRVFYRVYEEPEQFVDIVAVGIKVGNRLRIAGEVVDL